MNLTSNTIADFYNNYDFSKDPLTKSDKDNFTDLDSRIELGRVREGMLALISDINLRRKMRARFGSDHDDIGINDILPLLAEANEPGGKRKRTKDWVAQFEDESF